MTSDRHSGTGEDRPDHHPWDSEVELDEARAVEIVRADFPELSLDNVVSIGAGWSSFAFLIDERWIFRFPKRDEIEPKLEREAALLPALQQTLSVLLPAFAHVARNRRYYPFIYAGYRTIEGPFAWDLPDMERSNPALAASCGRFLAQLHRFPKEPAQAAGCEDASPTAPAQLAANVRRTLACISGWSLRAQYGDAIDRYLDELDFDRLGTPGSAVVVHGDLLPDHLLIDRGTGELRGVIDWGEVRVDDPAWDFSGLYYWQGRRFAESVLCAYERSADPGLLERARLIALEVGLGDIWYGLEEQLPRYYSAGVRCVDHCLGGAYRIVTDP